MAFGRFAAAVAALFLFTSLPAFGQCYFLECPTPNPPPVTPTTPPPPVVVFPPVLPRAVQQFMMYPGIDLYGDDLQWLTDQSLDGCMSACRATAGCVAFTVNLEKRLCMLKRGPGRRVPFAGATSGILPNPGPVAAPPAVRIRVEDHTGYYEGDLRNIKNIDHTACQAACINMNACVAYTYIRRSSSCWLKSTVNQSRYDPELISGIKY